MRPSGMRLALCALLVLTLSGCATLYSTQRQWRLPAGLGQYTLTAQMSVGWLTRQVTISVNDRPLLFGQGYWWTDDIVMASQLDGIPFAALCHPNRKQCELALAGVPAGTLTF